MQTVSLCCPNCGKSLVEKQAGVSPWCWSCAKELPPELLEALNQHRNQPPPPKPVFTNFLMAVVLGLIPCLLLAFVAWSWWHNPTLEEDLRAQRVREAERDSMARRIQAAKRRDVQHVQLDVDVTLRQR